MFGVGWYGVDHPGFYLRVSVFFYGYEYGYTYILTVCMFLSWCGVTEGREGVGEFLVGWGEENNDYERIRSHKHAQTHLIRRPHTALDGKLPTTHCQQA